jgi:hypothetical protein
VTKEELSEVLRDVYKRSHNREVSEDEALLVIGMCYAHIVDGEKKEYEKRSCSDCGLYSTCKVFQFMRGSHRADPCSGWHCSDWVEEVRDDESE